MANCSSILMNIRSARLRPNGENRMSTDTGLISYSPTDGLSYDPNDPVYWDRVGLAKEVQRVFEICNGCRLCFKFCDTFPDLFALLDKKHEGDVRRLEQGEID